MARLGVPVGGRVRKPRAVEDQSAPIPKEITSELGGIIYNLVRRAHSRIDQATLFEERNERAWKEYCRKAVGGERRNGEMLHGRV